jgi:hypothetical protein
MAPDQNVKRRSRRPPPIPEQNQACRAVGDVTRQLSIIFLSTSSSPLSDAIFLAAKASGRLTIGDKKEIDKAIWRRPRGIRLTPTSRYIRDKLFPKSN